MIIVPTIPGTGTHFVRDHLLAGKKVYCRHITEAELPKIIELMAEHPAIVPLRKPENVRQTWDRLARDNHGGWHLDQFYQALNEFILPLNPYLLHLDLPHLRDLELRMINVGLELHLETDWRVIRGNAQEWAHMHRDTAQPPAEPVQPARRGKPEYITG